MGSYKHWISPITFEYVWLHSLLDEAFIYSIQSLRLNVSWMGEECDFAIKAIYKNRDSFETK